MGLVSAEGAGAELGSSTDAVMVISLFICFAITFNPTIGLDDHLLMWGS